MSDDQLNAVPKPSRSSRYERVKEILNQASGDAHPSYQGHDRFWNLPHAQFLEVEIYGIRMIAPPAASSSAGTPPAKTCCHGAGESAAAAAPQPGRGAASGLIKGLKGEPSFDGSQFPRLPWGGSPVSFEDIAFIERWIDDGCPEKDDSLEAGVALLQKLHALASGNIAHALHQGPSNQFQGDI